LVSVWVAGEFGLGERQAVVGWEEEPEDFNEEEVVPIVRSRKRKVEL